MSNQKKREENRKKHQKFLEKEFPNIESTPLKGGNGFLWKVLRESQLLAVKSLYQTNRLERFKSEIQIMDKLKNIEGIVPLLASSTNNPECAYIVMPWYQNGSAEKLVSSLHDSSPDGSKAVEFMLDIARIIQKIHAINTKGYAHRDLKPANILINDIGKPHVADFGLCIDLEEMPDTRITPVYEIVGALAYRAPEFLRGRLDSSDHRPGDIFALGRMLWAFLVGKEPYQITDFEFSQDRTLQNRSIRRMQLLKNLIEVSTYVDPQRRIDISGFIAYLEEWQKQHAPHSTEGIIDSINENPSQRAYLENRNTAQEVSKHFEQLESLLTTELDALVVEWRKVKKMTQRGNEVVVNNQLYIAEGCPSSSLHANNPTHVLFVLLNIGNSSLAPMLNLSIAFRTDLNQKDNQECEIIAKYTPKYAAGQPMPTEFKLPWPLNFSYNDHSVPLKIVAKMKEYFDWLDEKMRSDMTKK